MMPGNNPLLSRRHFVSRSLLITGSVFVGGCDLDFRPDVSTFARHLVDILRHPVLASAIGRSLLERENDPEPDLKLVANRILNRIGVDANTGSYWQLLNLDARIIETVHRDFQQEHVVVVDGWLLSRTEADLCLLLHLRKNTV